MTPLRSHVASVENEFHESDTFGEMISRFQKWKLSKEQCGHGQERFETDPVDPRNLSLCQAIQNGKLAEKVERVFLSS